MAAPQELPSGGALAPEVLADRDVLHLRGHDAGAGIGELGHRPPAAGAQRRPAQRELRRGLAACGEAVVDELHVPPRIRLGVGARRDPRRAQRRKPGLDVDRHRRVGVGTGGIVDGQRRLAARRVQCDLAHRHPYPGMQPSRAIHLARGRKGFGNDVPTLRIHQTLRALRP
jgi:hypothetical protein